eukprot:1158224-Pelagomonas_calceolata.AAC.3
MMGQRTVHARRRIADNPPDLCWSQRNFFTNLLVSQGGKMRSCAPSYNTAQAPSIVWSASKAPLTSYALSQAVIDETVRSEKEKKAYASQKAACIKERDPY